MSRDPYTVVKHPYVKEKGMNLMVPVKETKRGDKVVKRSHLNMLIFAVDRRANKKEIKIAVEKLFDMKVERVNTYISKHGKRAIVKFKKEYSAEELGMRIGLI